MMDSAFTNQNIILRENYSSTIFGGRDLTASDDVEGGSGGSNQSPNQGSNQGSGLSVGAMAGIIVAVIVVVVAVIVTVILVRRKKGKAASGDGSVGDAA